MLTKFRTTLSLSNATSVWAVATLKRNDSTLKSNMGMGTAVIPR